MEEGNSGKFKRGRRPHNAKVLDFDTIGDLVRKLGAEPKKVTVDGKEVEMSWAERLLRLTLERALKGNIRDIAQLLRLMIKHPHVTGQGKVRMVYFLSRSLAANVYPDLYHREQTTKDDDNSEGDKGSSRVGYKSPPKEHRFQKGQKPPPRRRKSAPVEANITAVFWRVLLEKRRGKINGKGTWVSSTELLVRRAFIEAEKGSSTLQRLLNQMLLEKTSPDDEGPPEFEVLPW